VSESYQRPTTNDQLPTTNYHLPMHKPLIGIAGGIGSGKSFVARLFGELGCRVIHADDQIRLAYQDPVIRRTIAGWWGKAVLQPDGGVNRSQIAARIFSDPADRLRLERLLHPWVESARRAEIAKYACDPEVKAFILDTPLLFETKLNQECDAVVFVDTPDSVRLERVQKQRGWAAAELTKRENLQWPLDNKREISEYTVVNTADADAIRGQVRQILSRILEKRQETTRRDINNT
jgi:dephospho-CoA kinase